MGLYPCRNRKEEKTMEKMIDNNTVNAKLDMLLAIAANGALKEHRDTRGNEVTLKEIAEAWFDMKRHTVQGTTLGTYKTLCTIINNRFGDCVLSAISRKDIQSWFNHLRETYDNRTLKHLKGLLSSMLDMAVDDEYISRNPCRSVKLPKDTIKKKLPATHEDFQRLLEVSRWDNNWILIPLLFHTGCRIGEILALTWDDIDYDNMTINISKQYTRNNMTHQNEFKEHTKTPAGKRKVPMTQFLFACLKRYEAEEGNSSCFIVHQVRYNRRLNYTGAYQLFKRWRERANCMDITLHSARHYYTCLLMKVGVPLNEVSRVLGHSNISTTADIYAYKELSISDLKGVANKINRQKT